MDDFLQGFLPVAAIMSALAFGAFVRHFIVKELKRREFADTDNAGAEEGARIDHQEWTK